MQIEVTVQHNTNGPEVWVRVLSNAVLDWPSVEDKLNQEQRDLLAALGDHATMQYVPGWPGSGDDNYNFEEFWVWSKA